MKNHHAGTLDEFVSPDESRHSPTMGKLDIIGPEEDLAPVELLGATWRDIVNTVARIESSAMSGTGFLIAADLILTAHHVVPDREALSTADIRLGYVGGSAGSPLVVARGGSFRCSSKLDYTVFAVEPVSDVQPLALRDGRSPQTEEHVRVLGHRSGGRLESSGSAGTVQSVDAQFVEYTADTDDGMSGGPVLSAHRELLAMHHWGDHDDDQSNRGVLVTAIREDLAR